MLALLPAAAFLALYLLLYNLRPSWDGRRSFLRAAILCGAYLVLATEGLSLIRSVTPLGLSLTWGLPACLAVGGLAWQNKRAGRIRLPAPDLPRHWLDWLICLGVVAIVVVTAVTAWFAPPNTADSLNYHMPRVAHWAQLRSVRPFATGIEVQNSRTPGAEFGVLHLYVLAGGDRFANFVEWFAMIGCLVGVSLIASQLGSGRAGRVLSIVASAALPMGIIQASSTMTDYVVALWMVCVASESLSLLARQDKSSEYFFVGASAGLALVTKPTAFAYLPPFAALGAYSLLRVRPIRRAVAEGIVVLAAVSVLNAGQVVRSIQVYGSPLAGDQVGVHLNQLRTWRGLVSNVLRNAALQAGTPWDSFNRFVYLGVMKAHQLMALDVNDPRTTAHGEFGVPRPTTEEDRAGDPYHAILSLAAFGVLLVWRTRLPRVAWVYGLAVATTFLLFSFLFRWQVFGSRYHLPFFILFMPLIGLVVSTLLPLVFSRAIGFILLVLCWPWLVGIQQRPLLPDPATGSGSILVESRSRLWAGDSAYDSYTSLARSLDEVGCSRVGIMLSGTATEYLLWVFLGAPREDLQIEWIVSGTPSARFELPDFQPCAIICDWSCPSEWTIVRGLPLAEQIAGYRIFMERESPIDAAN